MYLMQFFKKYPLKSVFVSGPRLTGQIVGLGGAMCWRIFDLSDEGREEIIKVVSIVKEEYREQELGIYQIEVS